MKKKLTVLVALFLSVAVSAYSVAGTYAKYVSSIDATDEARVAKWNITAEPASVSEDLFKASYSNVNGTYVASLNDDDVVAPGTTGSYTAKFAGSAETAFYYDYALTKIPDFAVCYTVDGEGNLTITDATVADSGLSSCTSGTLYAPLKYQASIKQGAEGATYYAYGDSVTTDASHWSTATELYNWFNTTYAEEAVGSALKYVYGPNSTANQILSISWKWDTTTAVDDLNADQVDELDTAIGKKVALNSTTKNFAMNVAAKQASVDYSR